MICWVWRFNSCLICRRLTIGWSSLHSTRTPHYATDDDADDIPGARVEKGEETAEVDKFEALSPD
ncbi:hypothetical protein DIJ64_01955 [Mycobacterium leprae]|uniref:Uncharacterized protein n=1 Tax=Mycobacterium leprae TaxID=1769 RepID=A0AAD0P780_MYCLR|nr:hypothetical protein DIJ64_01955 [Mycobacterium leprae]OAR21501.1 hypothetical protein A8144_05680 [Mycobacterium leprae 3125609]OAX71440.1 hypothetical protein A3216_05825 [Mycobacterium leprae 7935681]